MTATAAPCHATTPHRSRGRVQLAAGIAYPVTWVVGLSVFTASTAVTSTGGQLLADYHGHSGRLLLQFLLTQGLAATLLAVVLVAAARQIKGSAGRVIRITGLAAVTVSLVQCALGALMACAAVPGRHAHAIGALSETINRLDGVKMILLAVTFACMAAIVGTKWWPTLRSRRRRGRLIAALRFGAAAATLFASAAGYLTLNNTWANAAFASLPLLLASVTTSAVLVYRDIRATQATQPRPATPRAGP